MKVKLNAKLPTKIAKNLTVIIVIIIYHLVMMALKNAFQIQKENAKNLHFSSFCAI